MSNIHDHDREFSADVYDKEYFEGEGKKSGYKNYSSVADMVGDQFTMIHTLMAPRLTKNMSVLDLGCAYGFGTAKLKELGWTRVEGVDISEHAILRARSLRDDVNYWCTDAARDATFWAPIMRAESKFGLITGTEFLEHIESRDVPKLLQMASQSAEWGVFVVNARTNPAQDVMENHGDHGHLNNHSMSWWINEFAKVGELDFDGMYSFSKHAEMLYPEVKWHNRVIVVKFNN